MKNGDLVNMPGETLVGKAVPSIGIVVDDKVTVAVTRVLEEVASESCG